MSTPSIHTQLDPDRISARLIDLGYNDAAVVQQTGSTNTDMVTQNPPHLSVLLAEEQTAGKGRLGRAWTAPKSSQIICTVVAELKGVHPESLGLVPLLTGTALSRALNAQVKWPNDLLVGGRKIAGILVEAIEITPVPKVAIGFGVNYDLTEEELPVPHATSYVMTGGTLSREDLIVEILRDLLEALNRFLSLGGASETVLPRYRQVSSTLGTEVRALLPGGGAIEGTAVDIAKDGSLVIETAEGRQTFSAGDVEHLR